MHWQTFHWIAGVILALAWFSRIVEAAIGMPRVADIARPEWDRRPATPNGEPKVSIIVPARNEAEHIRETLSQLLALDYPNYEVVVVNDRSTDRTGQIVDEVAASPQAHGLLKVIHISELPSGWLGKTHAMWRAGEQASGDWLLFTDADVLFKPDSLRRAVAYAEAERAHHVVLFPRMIMKSPGERMMIAFFQMLFVFGHRPWRVANPKARDHMGVGAFNMVRRSVYEAVGSYRALRMEVIDDMKLGKVVKNAGFAQRNVSGEDLISLRWAKGVLGIVNNLTKNFFAVLSFQWWRTVVTIVGLGFLNLGPFLGVWFAHGWARVPYAIALGSLFAIYCGMSFRSPIPPYYFFLHPISTSLFIYILLRSMVHTLWNDGIVWRGTKYPLEELRKGMV
ncbi:MAG TPA: glycosyltransferase [Terriglobales bacterium]|jgi:glycosyltransferase involved in cell wall biosynthesis|nr:glycosyltransferase [Terriglobales bacterium]